MINKYLASQIKSNFPFNPTAEQENCLENISEFILSADDRKVFMLCGYAGTGKTTLISALVKTMSQLERRCVLLAPTGRAAKVFSSYSGKSAYTIHKWIYRQKSILNGSPFVLMENRAINTLFIVDEASMIANEGGSVFGTGALLDDLIEFVYSGRGCSLLLLGKDAGYEGEFNFELQPEKVPHPASRELYEQYSVEIGKYLIGLFDEA